MFKRIISIFLALCLATSCLCVPAFAASSSDNVGEACGKYFNLLDQYLSGEIDYQAFVDKTSAMYHDVDNEQDRNALSTLLQGLTTAAEGISFSTANTSAAFVKLFRDTLKNLDDSFNLYEEAGGSMYDMFEELWNEFCSQNGYTNSDFDMKGYSSVIVKYSSDLKYIREIYYGHGGEFYNIQADSCQFFLPYDVKNTFNSSGDIILTGSNSSVSATWYFNQSIWRFYGTWTNRDTGLPEDSLTTPNNSTPVSPEEIDPNVDLTDFIRDLLKKLKDLFPDMSTIEGLLRAILAKCTSIDAKMNETGSGMNPEELQELLDKSILSLATQNKTNADTLLSELVKIRKAISGYDGKEIPPEEAKNIIDDLVPDLTEGLSGIVGLDLATGEIIDLCENAGELGVAVLGGIVDIFAFLSTSFHINVVSGFINSLNGIVFNENKPADLSFFVDGQEYILLSSSFFNSGPVASALNILKGLASILVAYMWLKWARKFYLSML